MAGQTYVIIKDASKLFFTSTDESFSDLTSSTTFAIVSFFNFSHSQVWWNLMVTVTYISPMTHVVKEQASHTQTGRKHLQIISLEKDVYLYYIKSSYNPIVRRQATCHVLPGDSRSGLYKHQESRQEDEGEGPDKEVWGDKWWGEPPPVIAPVLLLTPLCLNPP